MKRILVFSKRNLLEIIRDPLSVAFGMGLPILMLALFSIIQKSTPIPLFAIDNLAPAIAVFSFSFVSLFGGMLIAKDRTSSFVIRLYSSPIKPFELIIGYTIPLIIISLLQVIVCLLFSIIFGLSISINILSLVVLSLFISLIYIAFGLLFGSLFNEKQVGGIFALFINISAFLSGVWFDFTLVGETYTKICYLLPFAHSVDLARHAFLGEYHQLLNHFIWVFGYSLLIFSIAVFALRKKKKA